MEKDFMGLSSRQQPLLINEEVGDIGFKETGFCKSSAVQCPYFMSFGANQGGNSMKTGKSMRFSSAFKPFSASENQQVAPVSATNGFVRYPFAISGHNPLLLGGIPITNPHSVVLPLMNSFAGFSDSRKNAGSAGSPKLAIFYDGKVNIFDEISPEKALAIMSLANQTVDTTAVTESSNSATQPRTDKPVAANATHATGSFCPSNMIPSVPQARKASLARFLEKRRERLMNAAVPYKMGKKNFLESETGESSGMNYYPASEAA